MRRSSTARKCSNNDTGSPIHGNHFKSSLSWSWLAAVKTTASIVKKFSNEVFMSVRLIFTRGKVRKNAIGSYQGQCEVINIHDVKSQVLGTPELLTHPCLYQTEKYYQFPILQLFWMSLPKPQIWTYASKSCKYSIFSQTLCGHLKRLEGNLKKLSRPKLSCMLSFWILPSLVTDYYLSFL